MPRRRSGREPVSYTHLDVYKRQAQGFGGAITVQVTLANDEITDIQVTSAPGEDSAYLS